MIQIEQIIYRKLAYWLECSPNDPGKPGTNPRSSHTKDSKMVLDASLLNTQHYKVQVNGKVKQSRERSGALPTPWCSSYRKGSLRVTLD